MSGPLFHFSFFLFFPPHCPHHLIISPRTMSRVKFNKSLWKNKWRGRLADHYEQRHCVAELINQSLRSIINLVIMENIICVSELVIKPRPGRLLWNCNPCTLFFVSTELIDYIASERLDSSWTKKKLKMFWIEELLPSFHFLVGTIPAVPASAVHLDNWSRSQQRKFKPHSHSLLQII